MRMTFWGRKWRELRHVREVSSLQSAWNATFRPKIVLLTFKAIHGWTLLSYEWKISVKKENSIKNCHPSQTKNKISHMTVSQFTKKIPNSDNKSNWSKTKFHPIINSQILLLTMLIHISFMYDVTLFKPLTSFLKNFFFSCFSVWKATKMQERNLAEAFINIDMVYIMNRVSGLFHLKPLLELLDSLIDLRTCNWIDRWPHCEFLTDFFSVSKNRNLLIKTSSIW